LTKTVQNFNKNVMGISYYIQTPRNQPFRPRTWPSKQRTQLSVLKVPQPWGLTLNKTFTGKGFFVGFHAKMVSVHFNNSPCTLITYDSTNCVCVQQWLSFKVGWRHCVTFNFWLSLSLS